MCGSTFVLSSWGWAQFWRKSWITRTVHFARGRCHPQIQILSSVARTEESRSQVTVLGNQHWRLHCLRNVVWGPLQHGMFRNAPMWNGVPRLKRACAGVEIPRRPCWYFEHRPNVGCVSIVRKCLVRVILSKSPIRWGVTPLKTEVWEHTHTFTSHTFYPTHPASGCHAVRFYARTSICRRIRVTLNSPTKGRVEVVQLNFCDTTINRKYPFLTGPEKGFMNIHVLQELSGMFLSCKIVRHHDTYVAYPKVYVL